MKKRYLLLLTLSVMLGISCIIYPVFASAYSDHVHDLNTMSNCSYESPVQTIVGSEEVCYKMYYHQCMHTCTYCGYRRMFDHTNVYGHLYRLLPGNRYRCDICLYVKQG